MCLKMKCSQKKCLVRVVFPSKHGESMMSRTRVSYPEYVAIQREKDAGAYSVKAVLERDAYQ